jgi:hypothetical protein
MNPAAVYSPEIVCRYPKTKNDNAYPHEFPIYPGHHGSTQITAKQRAC